MYVCPFCGISALVGPTRTTSAYAATQVADEAPVWPWVVGILGGAGLAAGTIVYMARRPRSNPASITKDVDNLLRSSARTHSVVTEPWSKRLEAALVKRGGRYETDDGREYRGDIDGELWIVRLVEGDEE